MKPDLKRIETTLHQMAKKSPLKSEPVPKSRENQTDSLLEQPQTSVVPDRSPFFSLDIQAFSARKQEVKTPVLPQLKPPSFSNHRNSPNPALAMTLLKEIEEVVAGWQNELKQVVRQIQDVYLEGPIVDGWLESHSREPEAGDGTPRPTAVDRLMDYEEVETRNSASGDNRPDASVTCQSPRTGYRLCGLNEDGQFWHRPCPPEQVASVSMAIARYHKLRLLLDRKQHLETRLTQLAETLVVLHGHLNE